MTDQEEGVRMVSNIVGCPIEAIAVGAAVLIMFARAYPASDLNAHFWRMTDRMHDLA